MRRQDRHRLAQFRHRRGFGLGGILRRDAMLCYHAVEHAVARVAGPLRIAVEPAGFRRLRERDQEGGFRQRQPLWLLAEIGNGGRADSFEIAAERRQREIEVEDLVLAELPLDLDRTHDLMELGRERTMMARLLHQPRELHGDGRAAGNDVAAGHQLIGRARQRQRIDAGMRSEALVFIGEQQVQIGRIDVLLRVDRQPPAAVGHGIGAKQLSVAVDDGGRDLPRLHQRQRPERGDPGREGGGRDQTGDDQDYRRLLDPRSARQSRRRCYRHPPAHFADRTSTDPVPVRP